MQVEAVVFDWAGTVVDFGSMAPVYGFQSTFADFGIDTTIEQVRAFMGMEKRRHIEEVLALPEVAAQWLEKKGAPPTNDDIDEIYLAFIPQQIACIAENSVLIPGAAGVASFLHQNDIKIGTTTGYSRAMIRDMLQSAQAQGFDPDFVVASDEIAANRPAAAGALKNLAEFDVFAVHNCIKVDDTVIGIDEGLNAGMWTVAVALSGNALGISQAEWDAQDSDSAEILRANAYEQFSDCGVHFVIDTVADFEGVVKEIDAMLARGEKP